MKSRLSLLTIFFLVAFGLGIWSGCSVDFDSGVPGIFPCEDDEDCTDRLECSDEGFCDEPEPDDPQNQNDNTNQPQECIPEALGDDYPLDSPLDIQEVCDGQDNNCDGHVDVIFCDENENCPSSTDDPYGTRLNYQCNTDDYDPPRCEAFGPDTLVCPDPVECDSNAGEYEPVPNHCGGNIPD